MKRRKLLGIGVGAVALALLARQNRRDITVIVPKGTDLSSVNLPRTKLIEVDGEALRPEQIRSIVGQINKDGSPVAISEVLSVKVCQGQQRIAAVIATGIEAAQSADYVAGIVSRCLRGNMILSGIEPGKLSYEQAALALGYEKTPNGYRMDTLAGPAGPLAVQLTL